MTQTIMTQTIMRGIEAMAEAGSGLTPVAPIAGGFGAWRKAGGPVEAWVPKPRSRA